MLIITEKPTAAKSIADALSEGRAKMKKKDDESKAVWYEFSKGSQKFAVAPAVGHLFTLKQADKGWYYPVFNVEWTPSFKANRLSAFSEPYFRNLENLAKDAKDIIIATDYDEEGEVIGYNVLRMICGRKSAARMKFSTMTREELLDSYEHAGKINRRLVEAGLARHYLDFYWGISLTRALTLSIKKAEKRFRILSTGRVQGPVLHMLTKHEKKISAFKPKKFWSIELDVRVGKQKMVAVFEKDKIWKEAEAKKIAKKAVKQAIIKDIISRIMSQKPPKPYNTTSLLADIYRYFGYSPRQGMNIAESLYQAGLISYPRTSSEKLPKDIGYARILKKLAKQKDYSKDAENLLGKELKPSEGKRSDPAHPAIYPTGENARIGGQNKKVYDLIVRRFLAVFGDPAKRESQKIMLNAGGYKFFIHGRKTIEPGWLSLYGKYAKRDEIKLPKIKKGDKIKIDKTRKLDKETQPPSRFSQGSVLKEMEQRGLGTKATRAQILQILYNRGYLIGSSIEVTELGLQLSNILEKNVPDVVSEKLTRKLEEMTNAIQEGEATREKVLEEAKKRITRISAKFRKIEEKIGEELTDAVIATADKQSKLGTCKCSGTLKVHKNWKTGKRFVGCTGYKKGCRVGFPLPRIGVIFSTEKTCEECKTPIIQVRPPGKRPFRMCLDPECPTKEDWLDKKKLQKAKEESLARKAAQV